MASTALSVNQIAIRLTDERWAHIVSEHGELEGLRDEVLEAVSSPHRVFQGRAGELLAAQELSEGKWLVVVYREEAYERMMGL